MLDTIDKNDIKPAYLQVRDMLAAEIKAGRYKAGQKLPSENVLSQQYRIHRLTARRSLQTLADEGLVTSIAGRGWFVTANADETEPKVYTVGLHGMSLEKTHSSFFASLLNKLFEEATKYNFSLKILSYADVHSLETCGVCPIDIDCLVWSFPNPEQMKSLEQIASHGIKVLVLGRQLFDSDISFVAVDQYTGSREIVTRMINNGHERIGCITTQAPLRYAQERWRGYSDALTEAGLPVDEKLTLHVDGKIPFKTALINFFSHNPDMTALYLAGEVFHRQTLEYMSNHGIRIPEDMSVAVFDRVAINKYHDLITAVEQPMDDIGVQTLKMLQDIIQGRNVGGKILNTIVFEGKSIKRIK